MAKLPLATIREVLNIVDSGGNVPEAMRRTQESLIGKSQMNRMSRTDGMRRRSFSMQKSPNVVGAFTKNLALIAWRFVLWRKSRKKT